MMYDRYREEDLARRLAEELEQERREAREKAGAELARFILEGRANFSGSTEASAEAEAPSQSEAAPVRSADAGARGIEPEVRKTPGEQLAGILLFGEGVPAEPWRRGL